jgi:DNA polymerase-3 subunit gamma/tau
MALVRLARRPPLLPLDELLLRVADLERRLNGAPAGPLPRGGGGGGGGRAAHSPPASLVPASVASDPAATRTHGALALADAPVPRRSAEVTVPERALEGLRKLVALPASAGGGHIDAWCAIVERIRGSVPQIASVMEHAMPLEVGPEKVVVGFAPSAEFLATRASEPQALEELTRAVRAHFGAPTQVVIEVGTKLANGGQTVASIDAERRSADLAKARAAVEEHPVVKEAMRLFGAQLREVRLPGGDG